MDTPEDKPDEEGIYGAAVGPDILEKLLMAIIRANPFGEDGDAARLNKAMQALVGRSASRHTIVDDSDYKALRYMGELQNRDKVARDALRIKHWKDPNPPELPKVRTPHALAYTTAKHFSSCQDDESHIVRTAHRLREKFNATYSKPTKKRPNTFNAASYEYMAVEYDYVAVSMEHDALKEICSTLAKHGVQTKLKG